MDTELQRFERLDRTAAALGIPKETLRREAVAGTLPSVLIGRRRFFVVGQVREVLERRALDSVRQHEAVAR